MGFLKQDFVSEILNFKDSWKFRQFIYLFVCENVKTQKPQVHLCGGDVKLWYKRLDIIIIWLTGLADAPREPLL